MLHGHLEGLLVGHTSGLLGEHEERPLHGHTGWTELRFFQLKILVLWEIELMNRNPDFVFIFHPERREHFRAGELSKEWVKRYPDLFSFRPQTGEWFFAEVKCARDMLTENQISMHQQLEAMTARKVKVIQLDEIKF